MNDPVYTFADVARIFGISETAVRRLVKSRVVTPRGEAHCPRRFSWSNLLTIYNEGHASVRADVDETGVVIRFYPKVNGFRNLVSLNVKVCGGAPVIAGTRIPTEIVAGRFRAGDTVTELVCDFAATREQIQAALGYEGIWDSVFNLKAENS